MQEDKNGDRPVTLQEWETADGLTEPFSRNPYNIKEKDMSYLEMER